MVATPPPTSGLDYVAKLEQKLREIGIGKIASVSGRYYAMDRDKRWERQRKAFDAMVLGKGECVTATDAVTAIRGQLQHRCAGRVCHSYYDC